MAKKTYAVVSNPISEMMSSGSDVFAMPRLTIAGRFPTEEAADAHRRKLQQFDPSRSYFVVEDD